jgi:hypothetical protein
MKLVALAIAASALLAASGSARADTGPSCPSSNAPNTLTLTSGTPQSARLGTPFASELAVTVANTNGCPVTTPLAGIAVTFSAPSSGPSGTFASSGSNAVLVGTNAQGTAMAPAFTANSLPGGYLVTASSDYGSVVFSLVNTASGVSAAIKSVAGSGQSAGIGARYGAPLQVVVTDATGAPVGGATVTFSLGQGSAGAAGATFVGGANQATSVSDATGHASSPGLTANDVAGRFSASATTQGLVDPALFSLENKSGKGLSLRMRGAGRQSATVGDRYPHSLEAVVRNAAGRPVQGTTVTFSLGSGGGGSQAAASPGATFVGGSTQATAATDAHGVAVSPLFTAGSASGSFTATASATGVMRPVTYSLRNLPGRSASIAVDHDPPGKAVVDARFPNRLRARILDGSGHPVVGAAVTFALGGQSAAGSAGASFAGGSAQAAAVTDGHGIAVSPVLTANSVAGTFAATATSTAAPGTITFALRNLPGTPATITPGAATGETTTAGSTIAVRPAVVVTDAKGNVVPGAIVTFTAPAHGASGRFGRKRIVHVKTNTHGIAVAPSFRANELAGGYALRVNVRGARPSAFALVNLPRG